ncbi:MAG: hypothetical protein AB8G16_16965 [Gammaproteobacteria bacterium]
MRGFVLLLALFAVANVGAQSASETKTPTTKSSDEKFDRRLRLLTDPAPLRPLTRPRRANGRALRYENLSDIEAREIEAIATRINPGAIVNIASVTTGCPCEEGASCTDQVWVVAENERRSLGLMLSRIDEVWQIGPLQKWWREYDAIAKRHLEILRSKRASPSQRQGAFLELARVRRELMLRFPTCSASEN